MLRYFVSLKSACTLKLTLKANNNSFWSFFSLFKLVTHFNPPPPTFWTKNSEKVPYSDPKHMFSLINFVKKVITFSVPPSITGYIGGCQRGVAPPSD
jgi:hypothetical protein